jgi:hypothetical protein
MQLTYITFIRSQRRQSHAFDCVFSIFQNVDNEGKQRMCTKRSIVLRACVPKEALFCVVHPRYQPREGLGLTQGVRTGGVPQTQFRSFAATNKGTRPADTQTDTQTRDQSEFKEADSFRGIVLEFVHKRSVQHQATRSKRCLHLRAMQRLQLRAMQRLERLHPTLRVASPSLDKNVLDDLLKHVIGFLDLALLSTRCKHHKQVISCFHHTTRSPWLPAIKK